MKKLVLCILLAAATFAVAEIDFYDIPGNGSAISLYKGGKIVWVDGVSTNEAWTPAVRIVRESWTAATNGVPVLAAAETNVVTAGTSFAAPGDKFLLATNAPAGGRATVTVER